MELQDRSSSICRLWTIFLFLECSKVHLDRKVQGQVTGNSEDALRSGRFPWWDRYFQRQVVGQELNCFNENLCPKALFHKLLPQYKYWLRANDRPLWYKHGIQMDNWPLHACRTYWLVDQNTQPNTRDSFPSGKTIRSTSSLCLHLHIIYVQC